MTRRGHGPRALAAAVAKVTSPLFRKRGFADGAIVRDWPNIVGPVLAAQSAPEKVVYRSGRRNDGVLFLRVASGSLAIELQHLENQVVERINVYFGYRAIGRLNFIQGPLPELKTAATPPHRELDADQEEDLAQRLEAVRDPDLRLALRSLGRAVLGRRGSAGRG